MVRPPGGVTSSSTGMLETGIWPFGVSTASEKTAFTPGSSHMGAKRRASEFSNWVKRARFFVPSASS